MLGIHGLYTEF